MQRLLVNLKKSGKNNFTPTLQKNKQAALSELKAEYNADGMYLNAENVYYEVSEYIANALHACKAPVAVPANSTAIGNCSLSDGTRGSHTP